MRSWDQRRDDFFEKTGISAGEARKVFECADGRPSLLTAGLLAVNSSHPEHSQLMAHVFVKYCAFIDRVRI